MCLGSDGSRLAGQMMLQTRKEASVPRGYPPEFRRKVPDLVEAGRPIRPIAHGPTSGSRRSTSGAVSASAGGPEGAARQPPTAPRARHAHSRRSGRPEVRHDRPGQAVGHRHHRASHRGGQVLLCGGPSWTPIRALESFWGRMQTELLNRRRRHSALGVPTPIEFEPRRIPSIAWKPATRLPVSGGTSDSISPGAVHRARPAADGHGHADLHDSNAAHEVLFRLLRARRTLGIRHSGGPTPQPA